MKFFFKSAKPQQNIITLTSDEAALLGKLDIADELGIAIKTKTQSKIEGLYELQMGDNYPEAPKLRGIKSLVDKKVTIPKMLQSVMDLQIDHSFSDYHILSCGHFGDDKDYFIAAIKTNDKYECLRIFETNGVNYNLETDNIIEFFIKWESQARFSIIDAYHDRVIIQLLDFDFDLEKFAKEALEFCPDFLAAVEDEEQLRNYILERKGEVDFWWD